jgi:hypothetical protein
MPAQVVGSDMSATSFFTKYGLAICCILAPLIFGYGLPNYVANKLMPFNSEKNSPVTYMFSEADAGLPATADRKAREAAAKEIAKAESAKLEAAKSEVTKLETSTSAADVAKLPAARAKVAELEQAAARKTTDRVNQQSKQIAETLSGRYGYAAASGLLYVAAAATLLFSAMIVFQRGKWRVVVAGLVVFSLLAWLLTRLPTAYEDGGRFLLSLLDRADDSDTIDWLRNVQLDPDFKVGGTLNRLIWINTFCGLMPVGLALLAFGLLAVRPAKTDLTKEDLGMRLKALRTLIILSSVILVLATFASKTLLDWPLKLVMDNQAKALQPLANALTAHLGITGTIALFAAALPAILAWSEDVTLFRSTNPPPSTGDGLEFATSSMVTTVVAIIAPATISPIFNQLQLALSAFGKSG